MLSWQEKVTSTDAKWVVARVCRRAGKSFLAVRLAISKPDQKVMILVPYESQARLIGSMIQQYGSLITGRRDNYYELSNGSTIEIVAASNLAGVRGKSTESITRLIVDEAGAIEADNIIGDLMADIWTNKSTQVFMLSTDYKKRSVMEGLVNRRPSSALYVSYDYVDALRDKQLTPAFVFELKDKLSPSRFANDLGPYTTFDIDNQSMEYVLRDLSEYE